ncbi:hypothetical protein BOO69_20780 (plasmid) [Sulfitobacter alexandrii]|uniref:Uncharacterized protein n=1 Tax=Sulfitobacter alexandrii TaxID=1917485 RepID=A0A1J0WNU0_9RHOB|nr:hypothetical protein [Sulfitobacter alexandrii]APE45991.1 hypothetical protein BOO69_20780 [Sulfitobacter alexandrii]
MKPSVARMMQGIVETLRDDVIPHVGDGYARGQALGVIDLLNNYGARLDWDGVQIAGQIAAKRAALAEAEALAGGSGAVTGTVEVPQSTALLAEAAELDRQISERLLGWMAEGAGAEAAVARLRRHMHDELREDMKLTHRPSFAEIAKGGASGKESGT